MVSALISLTRKALWSTLTLRRDEAKVIDKALAIEHEEQRLAVQRAGPAVARALEGGEPERCPVGRAHGLIRLRDDVRRERGANGDADGTPRPGRRRERVGFGRAAKADLMT